MATSNSNKILLLGDSHAHVFKLVDNAANTNDETLAAIHSPQLEQHFTREVVRLWEKAELGMTTHIQHKLSHQRIRCRNGAMRS